LIDESQLLLVFILDDRAACRTVMDSGESASVAARRRWGRDDGRRVAGITQQSTPVRQQDSQPCRLSSPSFRVTGHIREICIAKVLGVPIANPRNRQTPAGEAKTKKGLLWPGVSDVLSGNGPTGIFAETVVAQQFAYVLLFRSVSNSGFTSALKRIAVASPTLIAR
jgi:hypothetical protein